MSVNSVMHKTFLPELAVLQALIKRSFALWKKASTIEDRLMVESELIILLEKLMSLTDEFNEVSPLEHLDKTDLQENRGISGYALQANLSKLGALTRLYVDYYNSQQESIDQVIGSLKRSRQKLATLRLWDRTKNKYVLSEDFFNTDYIDFNLISKDPLNVNTHGAYCTLPIASTDEVSPFKVTITKRSNGVPGNSDLNEIVTENRLPSFTIDNLADTWFEYERKDSGPLELGLRYEFGRATLINNIHIEAVPIGEASNFMISDIFITKHDNSTVNIRDLVSPTLPDGYFEVKTVGSSYYFDLPFMPVKCKNITIRFIQNHFYITKSHSADGRYNERKRFSIGIRSVDFYRHKYKSSGGINSVSLNAPAGLYGATGIATIHPRQPKLYSAQFNVSVDNGENWQNDILDLPKVEGETILCDGDPFNVFWSLEVKRNNEIFINSLGFDDEEPKINSKSLQKTVSRNVSPIKIGLTSKPFNKEVYVIQPKVAKRSSKDFVTLGYLGSEDEIRLEMPFDIIDAGFNHDDLIVTVNGVEWTRINDSNHIIEQGDQQIGLGWGTYYMTPDNRYLVFKPSSDSLTPEINKVKFTFREERPVFNERSDGYYCNIKQLFDPDKENIKILNLPSGFQRSTQMLPRGRNRIYLGSKYINPESFSISSLNDTYVYEKMNSLKEVTDSKDCLKYYLDNINGVLYLGNQNQYVARVTFDHATPSFIPDSSYHIWFDGIEPIGLIIDPDALPVEEIQDTIGIIKKRIDPITGEYKKRSDPVASVTNGYTLSCSNIILGSVILSSEVFGYVNSPPPTEVPYLDGYTEFLGLIPMDHEYTPGMEANLSGMVTFSLAAAENWYRPLGLSFESDQSVFLNERKLSTSDFINESINYGSEDIGKYHIANDGTVRLYAGVGNALPGLIKLFYYYKNPIADHKNKFSVDYEKGILYLSEDLDSSKARTVRYKTSSTIIGYDISKEINTYKYDPESNSVEVRTENLSKINNLIKVIWGEKAEKTNIDDIKEYFTPIIYNLGIRFQ